MIKKIFISALVIIPIMLSSGLASAADWTCYLGKVEAGPSYTGTAKYCCGSTAHNNTPVATSIDFGCQGKGNPIEDMLFAFIKFLSDGVGLVIIASFIVAGIQFTSSRGDPQATAKSMARIQSNVTALILFIFGYAILNYLVPGAVLK